MRDILIAPSLLSADFSNMAGGVNRIQDSRADWVHLDVMDGSFVPVITFGSKMISDLRQLTKLPFDVHLMVQHPETFIDTYIDAGADHITIHAEAAVHLHRILSYIKDRKIKSGISIVPSTPVNQIEEILPLVDIILIMTVNPGFGGQKLLHSCLKKVNILNELKIKNRFEYLVEVDGGINQSTAARAVESGADVLVIGSAFFNSSNSKKLVQQLRAVRINPGGT